jgi:hypothetical protein
MKYKYFLVYLLTMSFLYSWWEIDQMLFRLRQLIFSYGICLYCEPILYILGYLLWRIYFWWWVILVLEWNWLFLQIIAIFWDACFGIGCLLIGLFIHGWLLDGGFGGGCWEGNLGNIYFIGGEVVFYLANRIWILYFLAFLLGFLFVILVFIILDFIFHYVFTILDFVIGNHTITICYIMLFS